MVTTEKRIKWNGEKKAKVRNLKVGLILNNYTPGSYVVTLPGGTCLQEKALLDGGIQGKNIVGIQRIKKIGGIDGKLIYKNIRKFTDKHGIFVWPGEAENLFRALKQKSSVQTTTKQNGLLSTYFAKKTHITISPISCVDLDLCGIISNKLFKNIETIFDLNLTDDFVLCLNVLKGRDLRGGKLYKAFIKRGISDKNLYNIRYKHFPYVVSNIARKVNYNLVEPVSLYEYSDRNSKNRGTTMLQFIFKFSNKIQSPLTEFSVSKEIV